MILYGDILTYVYLYFIIRKTPFFIFYLNKVIAMCFRLEQNFGIFLIFCLSCLHFQNHSDEFCNKLFSTIKIFPISLHVKSKYKFVVICSSINILQQKIIYSRSIKQNFFSHLLLLLWTHTQVSWTSGESLF